MRHTIRRPILLPLVIAIVTAGCSPVELTSVVDTQFLLGSRMFPLNSVLIVYDSRDLAMKQEFESDFRDYLIRNSSAQVHTDIELYSPLKRMAEKEKIWALKDNGIVAVIYIPGGGSGRPLRDWLLPEAPEIDTETQAWKSSVVKVFLPATAQVVWAGSIAGTQDASGEVLHSKGFFSAVTADLIRRGILDIPRAASPGLPGFNR